MNSDLVVNYYTIIQIQESHTHTHTHTRARTHTQSTNPVIYIKYNNQFDYAWRTPHSRHSGGYFHNYTDIVICIQQMEIQLLLHSVMGRSLRFNAHVTCSLLQRVLHTHCIQQTEYSYCYTLWWDDLYCLIHMSHARYYNACWGLTHTLYSANGIQLLLHTVMGRSLLFNTHVTCSLLQRVLHTHCIQQTEYSYCYTLWWDDLYGLMHMSHAHYYSVCYTHIVFSKRNTVIVTHCDETIFTV